MDDEEFFRWYGAWDPLDPPGVAALMAGFDRPWWIVGGWSIEAFTGVRARARGRRPVDPGLRHPGASGRTSATRWTPWSIDGGTLRPLSDRFPEVLNVESQIWIRRSAHDPWVVDLPITPDRDGLWTSKRDPDHVVPVEEATWVAADGIRYLRPEIALLYKAALHRPKDDRRPGGDLAAAGVARAGLAARVRRPALPGPRLAAAACNACD